ncbi:MAG: hypothetical protein WAM58_09150, partial [Candidatus Acidiferrum sp.]
MKLNRVLLLIIFLFLFLALGNSSAPAQQFIVPIRISHTPQETAALNPPTTPASQDPSQPKPADPKSTPAANGTTIDSPQPKTETDTDQTGTQTKRILWIVPNFRSVSANTHLPPQSTKEKFWLATQESFDYSAFIYEGIVSGIAMAGKSEPTFGQGASGYGLYYAHTFADGTIENYMV